MLPRLGHPDTIVRLILRKARKEVEMNSTHGFVPAVQLSRGQSDRIPTGSLFLDVLLGGGWIAGSIVELAGEAQTGKSFLAAKTAANIQKGVFLPSKNTNLLDTVGWVDIENQISNEWLMACGVDLNKLAVQAEFALMEEALEALIAAVRTRQFGMVVYDSVGASMPGTITEDEKRGIGDVMMSSVQMRARIMGIALSTLMQVYRMKPKEDFNDYNPTLSIFLNHLQVDLKASGAHYTVMESVGGMRLKMLATTRLEMWTSYAKDDRIEIKLPGKDPISVGQKTYFKLKKHRGSAKESVGWFTMYRMDCEREGVPHVQGEIDTVQEVADIMAATPIGTLLEIQKGNWFNLNGEKLQGVKQLTEYLRREPEALADLTSQIRVAGKQLYT